MNDSEVTDAQLIRLYRNGDSKAFEKIVIRYRERLFAFLLRYAGSRQTAEDLFQDVFIRVIKNLDKYNEQGKFSQWLFGLAANLATDFYRKDKKRKNVLSDTDYSFEDSNTSRLESMHLDVAENPERQIITKEQVDFVLNAVKKLPEEQRLVFTLRENGGMTFREIAEMTGTPINTVLARMRYAVTAIKKSVSVQYDGEKNE